MKRINSIKLHNYGAFYNGGYDRITLPQGENLLIYGENGSGKSSMYKALQDFFQSAEEPAIYFNVNKRLSAEVGFVEVSFFDTDKKKLADNGETGLYKFASDGSSDNAQPFIVQANRLKGFLSYHNLVKTYAIEAPFGNNPDLYSVFIGELLGHHKLPISNKFLYSQWAELLEGLNIRDAKFNAFKDAVAYLPSFTDDIAALINEILKKVNAYLNTYFELGIVVSVEHLNVTMNPDTYEIIKSFRLSVSVTGQQFDGYHTYLNEARLSALAICFYLASIRINPMSDEYKILFLDDIFIGLDTSNRLPLLRILEDEFPNFQIFISTYDRNWYETAKHWFDHNAANKWRTLELYTDDYFLTFEKPLVFKGRTNIEKAEEHFLKRDYPAAANALRRECEEIIRKILPVQYHFESDQNTGVTVPIKKTETLYHNLIKFLEYVGCDATFIKEFRFFQKNIFNPLSHNDIIVPHYRLEIAKAIDFIKKLSEIKCVEVVPAHPDSYGILQLDITNFETGMRNRYDFFCLDPLYAIKIGAGEIKFSDPRCNVYHKETATHFYHSASDYQTLKKCFKTALRYQKHKDVITPDPYKMLRFRNGRSLASRMKFE